MLWSPCAALWYGDGHASSVGDFPEALPSFREEIAALCPNQRLLFRNKYISLPDFGWVRLDRVAVGEEIDLPWDVVVAGDAAVAELSPFADGTLYEDRRSGIVYIGRQ